MAFMIYFKLLLSKLTMDCNERSSCKVTCYMKSVLNIKDFEKGFRCTILCNKFQLCLFLYTCLKQLLGVKGHQQKKPLLVFLIMLVFMYKHENSEGEPYLTALTFRSHLIYRT